MVERVLKTEKGTIHYEVDVLDPEKITLIFLPGLTADSRLFEKQLDYFVGKQNVFVWDAPGHYRSRPYDFSFDLFDKAKWLKDILDIEEIKKPIIVGQSMGGYVGQAFMQLYPDRLTGYMAIDSAPLALKYASKSDLFLLKHTRFMYRCYPWKWLLRDGAKGCSTTEYGQIQMSTMMEQYGSRDYSILAGHGFAMLANAIEKDLPYEITCPAMILCGDKDAAGTTKKYDEAWSRETGVPLYWIKDAGHNSNSDNPNEVNSLIEKLIQQIEKSRIDVIEIIKANVLGVYDNLERGYEFDVDIPEDEIFVQGDACAIDQILTILISNAFLHGSDGKYIGVFLRETDKHVYIDVVDHGKGIENESDELLFEGIYLGEDSNKGLGLTLAKKLAKKMGGDIFSQSMPNIRTSFTLKLRK